MPARGSVSTHNTDLATLDHLLLPLGQFLGLGLLRLSWGLGIQGITEIVFGLGWEVEVGIANRCVVHEVTGICAGLI